MSTEYLFFIVEIQTNNYRNQLLINKVGQFVKRMLKFID